MWQTTDGYPNDNFYELRYKCGDYETTTKFNSMINAYDLTRNLQGFLASCSWSDDQVKEILRIDEDDVEFDKEEEEDDEEDNDE